MKCFHITVLILLTTFCHAERTIDVWPEGKVPGEVSDSSEALVPRNDGFTRITNVSRPALEIFPANNTDDESACPKPAVIICPGGAYRYVVVDKEGSEIAERLNVAGVTALVLKYRNPNNRDGALQDLQRSIRLTRARAKEWNIDSDNIGVMGFSAGGHLSARASAQFEQPIYKAIDSIDEQSCRPDFVILIYPAYLDDGNGGVSQQLNLKADIPPTLIVHSEDDNNHVVGSKAYSKALKSKGVSHLFLLYKTGGHGYGLHSKGEAKIWPDQTLEWMGGRDEG